jgi:hypothetical protein
MSKVDDYFLAGLDGIDRVCGWIQPVGPLLGEVFCRLLGCAGIVLLTPFVFINWLCGGSDD